MEASLQPITQGYIIRVHPRGGYGDEYTWCCTVEIIGDTATIYGVLRAPTKSERTAAAKILREHGVTHVAWERRKAASRTVRVTI